MSKIQWTDRTWNPTRGCSRVSEGCRNCYAEKIAARFSDVGKPFYGFADIGTRRGEARWTGKVALVPEKLTEPLRWKKPARVFVNSMSDLFHEKLTDHEIARVFAVMASAPRHAFQVLTKRPERMLNFFMAMSLVEAPVFLYKATGGTWPLPNVWLGVSVEDQATADERIPFLLETPAAVRFVSYEPALAPVDFTEWLHDSDCEGSAKAAVRLAEWECTCCDPREVALDWLIVGGESGPGARPFDVEWARSTIAACRAAGVACFVKQVGSNPRGWEEFDGERIHRGISDRKGGDPDEWDEDLRVREFPT